MDGKVSMVLAQQLAVAVVTALDDFVHLLLVTESAVGSEKGHHLGQRRDLVKRLTPPHN